MAIGDMACTATDVTTSGTVADQTWITWNTTATADSTDVWIEWVDNSTTTTTFATSNSTDNSVWYVWNEGVGVIRQSPNLWGNVAPETTEDRELREARERRSAAEKRLARMKARRLLRNNLSEDQQKELEDERSFTVIGQNGRRRYRIKHGHVMNIEEVDESGKKIRTICAHVHHGENLPDEDHMLAQKLHLEHNEVEFLKAANFS